MGNQILAPARAKTRWEVMEWLPIESAPKDGTADPESEPPRLLLLFSGGDQAVCYWDGYWVEPCSGEQVSRHYGEPIMWQDLPAPPGGSDG